MNVGGSASALLLGAITIAALHALIPSHWLAFAIVARAQRWPMRRTLGMTALAGTGHVLMTVVLGVGVAAAGKSVLRSIPPALEHAAAAGSLILLGLWFALPSLRGRGGCVHQHGHGHGLAQVGDTPQWTTMGALVMGMTLSPCLDLLSVYVAASTLPWPLIGALSLLMAATTLTIMVLLVWLTLHGLQRLRLHWLEHNEGAAVGGLLIALGIVLFFL